MSYYYIIIGQLVCLKDGVVVKQSYSKMARYDSNRMRVASSFDCGY